jgi:hypothetical protein
MMIHPILKEVKVVEPHFSSLPPEKGMEEGINLPTRLDTPSHHKL